LLDPPTDADRSFPGATYVGCYRDADERDLPLQHFQHDQMTLDVCFAYCQSQGYSYFGVQVNTIPANKSPDGNVATMLPFGFYQMETILPSGDLFVVRLFNYISQKLIGLSQGQNIGKDQLIFKYSNLF